MRRAEKREKDLVLARASVSQIDTILAESNLEVKRVLFQKTTNENSVREKRLDVELH